MAPELFVLRHEIPNRRAGAVLAVLPYSSKNADIREGQVNTEYRPGVGTFLWVHTKTHEISEKNLPSANPNCWEIHPSSKAYTFIQLQNKVKSLQFSNKTRDRTYLSGRKLWIKTFKDGIKAILQNRQSHKITVRQKILWLLLILYIISDTSAAASIIHIPHKDF